MDWNKSKRSSFSVGSFKPNNFNEYDRFQLLQNSPQNSIIQSQGLQSQLPVRSAYYETHWPLFASDWSRHGNTGTETVAISSYREDAINKIEILDGSTTYVEHSNGQSMSESINFTKIAETNINLPITNLQWDPAGSEKLITTNDRLKLWEVDNYNNQLIERLNLINGVQHNHNGHPGFSNKPQSLPPLTSFDWNKISPNIVITSSIDTTCTVWDLLHPSSPKTQLIAHDSEVFDVEFIQNSSDIFASVGNDGSMRVFDLRSLEHSTIIYEPPLISSNSNTSSSSSSATLNSNTSSSGNNNQIPTTQDQSSTNSTALLRLSTSNVDPNVIATFSAKSDQIIILDMRYPGIPTNILAGHNGSVNSIEWHPTKQELLSGGDDCQAFIWDYTNSKSKQSSVQHSSINNSTTTPIKSNNSGNVIEYPDFAYNDNLEVNNVTWNTDGDWIGVVSGKGFQGVKV
ncbi:putative WD repeat-containing protein [Wickerhamomyces ciferrii]|uniref:WD repeat-containing protein n=1 Tax=Wickerhamomyces ciferrii (strain ATCC 14091 / BCRC 22168 / CBS 111 / JCM 3599 / NBRC 0793 / NRRL Y-1031 F-60-10) TaxID=1206466 RepID=K0KPG8_WICCF|nr:putative WD repeat-containing protein [Wickerhamomyces ciferrii]CCH44871.1 putative WD repeat-containing protein [Wickerhamomyces ciferrii]